MQNLLTQYNGDIRAFLSYLQFHGTAAIGATNGKSKFDEKEEAQQQSVEQVDLPQYVRNLRAFSILDAYYGPSSLQTLPWFVRETVRSDFSYTDFQQNACSPIADDTSATSIEEIFAHKDGRNGFQFIG